MSKLANLGLPSSANGDEVDNAASQAAGRRRRKTTAWLLWPPTLLMLCFYAYLYYASKADLAEALAELDRREPGGWRLEDLERQRPIIPDEENSALQIIATQKVFPLKWAPVEHTGHPTIRDLPPEVQLTGKQTEDLTRDLRSGAGARVVAAARKLADMPDGRFPIQWSDDWISTKLDDVQLSAAVVSVLGYDARLLAQEGDADGACRSCCAILNTARAMRDEARLDLFRLRGFCSIAACLRIERVLAQGQPSDASLVNLQGLLEREERELSLLPAFRGERAGADRACVAVQAGKVRLVEPRAMFTNTGLDNSYFLIGLSTGSMDRNRAAFLRYLTRCVEVAKLPVEQQVSAFKQLQATLPQEPYLLQLLALPLTRTAEDHRRRHAWLRSAIVAVAAERFRRKNSRWPVAIDELAPVWLARAPVDPYDGQPLRYRRLPDGVVVYTLGEDGVDSGGVLERKNPAAVGVDLGFRLWDVEHRRQSPAPEKPAPPGTP